MVVDNIPKCVSRHDVRDLVGQCGEIFNLSFDDSEFSDEHTSAYIV